MCVQVTRKCSFFCGFSILKTPSAACALLFVVVYSGILHTFFFNPVICTLGILRGSETLVTFFFFFLVFLLIFHHFCGIVRNAAIAAVLNMCNVKNKRWKKRKACHDRLNSGNIAQKWEKDGLWLAKHQEFACKGRERLVMIDRTMGMLHEKEGRLNGWTLGMLCEKERKVCSH